MSKITDYPDAVERIYDAEGDNDALFEQDVIDALKESQHVNDRTAREIAENGVATIESVQAALEGEGELPDLAELASTVDEQNAAGVDLPGRDNQVASDLADAFVLQDDINQAVAQSEIEADGVTFDSDVSDALDDTTDGKQFVGADRSQVERDAAVEADAVSQSSFESAAFDAATQNSVSADNYDNYDGQGADVSLVESEGGDVVGVVGGAKNAVQAVADAEGAKPITGNPTDTFQVERDSRDTATLKLDGKTVDRFDT